MANLGTSGTTQYEAMVQTAIDHLVAGPPELDIGRIAEETGIPSDVALKLFPDGRALRIAAAEGTLRRMVDHLATKAAAAGEDPVAQFRAICTGYVEWALDHPRAFQVLNNRAMFLQSVNGGTERYNRSMRELTRSLLVRAQDAGRLRPGTDIDVALFWTRALLHGMSTIVIHRIAAFWTDAEDVSDYAPRSVDAYLDTLFLPEE